MLIPKRHLNLKLILGARSVQYFIYLYVYQGLLTVPPFTLHEEALLSRGV